MSPVIYWFRQDLRLADLPALQAAIATTCPVIPVYILDPGQPIGAASRWWLHHSLQKLDQSLRQRGSRLILRTGAWCDQLARLRTETNAEAIFATRLHEPAARTAERTIDGLRLLGGATLFNPDLIRSQTGSIYQQFTAFARFCTAAPAPPAPLPAPETIPAPPQWPASDQFPPYAPAWAQNWPTLWHPGESGAQTALKTFQSAPIVHYDTDRDRPDRPGTSRLSPHLHFGEISPTALWHATAAAEKFRAEILWREFAFYLLWHRPTMPEQNLRPEFAAFPWRHNQPELTAWQQGRTGIPIVDAGMRELWQTGFMHNRVRMIVASFLTKHLLQPWQNGAAWFLDTLLDADLAANSTNWQWSAGCGVDAQPFFRIFNPVTQGTKFDPDGTYVRRFVPALRSLPAAAIHAPWLLPPLERQLINYPPPLIDLAAGRARALAAFGALK